MLISQRRPLSLRLRRCFLFRRLRPPLPPPPRVRLLPAPPASRASLPPPPPGQLAMLRGLLLRRRRPLPLRLRRFVTPSRAFVNIANLSKAAGRRRHGLGAEFCPVCRCAGVCSSRRACVLGPGACPSAHVCSCSRRLGFGTKKSF
jgi:hypothetical protein